MVETSSDEAEGFQQKGPFDSLSGINKERTSEIESSTKRSEKSTDDAGIATSTPKLKLSSYNHSKPCHSDRSLERSSAKRPDSSSQGKYEESAAVSTILATDSDLLTTTLSPVLSSVVAHVGAPSNGLLSDSSEDGYYDSEDSLDAPEDSTQNFTGPVMNRFEDSEIQDFTTHRRRGTEPTREDERAESWIRLESMIKTHGLRSFTDKLPDKGRRLIEEFEQMEKARPTEPRQKSRSGRAVFPVAAKRKRAGNEVKKLKVESAAHEIVKQMNDAIRLIPGDKMKLDTPKGFRVQLLPHQQQAVAWMCWREGQPQAGGILADDMGLGKTVTMMALMVHQKAARKARKEAGEDGKDAEMKEDAKKKGLVPSKGTLIVAPASLVHQWEAELEKRLEKGTLSLYVFYGTRKQRSVDAHRLSRYDVVITTYTLIGHELIKKEAPGGDADDSESEADAESGSRTDSVLAKIHWERVVLDESQYIKNRHTKSSKSVCLLSSHRRWCLSGTPVQNNLWDVYCLIRFLRVPVFDDDSYWKTNILPMTPPMANRLNFLVKVFVLRRTKEIIGLDLPQKIVTVHSIHLTDKEAEMYSDWMEEARVVVSEAIRKSRPLSDVLLVLLRLRQASNHFSITRSALALEELNLLGFGDEDSLDDSEDVMLRKAGTNEEIERPDFRNNKVGKIMDLVKDAISLGDKVVIVSQWSTFLSLLRYHIDLAGYEQAMLTGKVSPKQRQEMVGKFNQKDGPQVLLLSLTAGGVGLNLDGGNHLVLADAHWNPALEQQAADRVHRYGQTKTVFIHRLITEGTVEQEVDRLQKRKMMLAEDVLTGHAESTTSKLTPADLRMLFDLE